MKILLLICLMLMFFVFIKQDIAEISKDAFVGAWLFNEDQGKIARDSTGNGHDGEIGNGIKWTDGQYGSKSLLFPLSAQQTPGGILSLRL